MHGLARAVKLAIVKLAYCFYYLNLYFPSIVRRKTNLFQELKLKQENNGMQFSY